MKDELKLKIIIRFLLWYNYLYNISFKKILKNEVKNSKNFKILCDNYLFFNLYITGFINFCEYLNLNYSDFDDILNKKDQLKEIEKKVNEIMNNINNKFLNNDNVNYNEIYEYLLNL